MKANRIQANSQGGRRLVLAAENTQLAGARVEGTAYSGGQIGQTWSGAPVVVDLASLVIAEQVPLMYNHYYSPEFRLGVVHCRNDGRQITFDGEIDIAKALGAVIVEEGKKYEWQASIGSDPVGDVDEVKAGQAANVNGREFTGPLVIVRGAKLREVSVVALGADSDTHIRIAAGFIGKKGGNKEMDERLKKYIIAKYKLGDNADEAAIMAHLQKVGSTPEKEGELMAKAEQKNEPQQVQAALGDGGDAVSKAVQAALAKREAEEKNRRDAISNLFGDEMPELKLKAITENWTLDEAKTEMIKALRASKPAVPNVYSPGSHTTHGEMIHAAALISAGVKVDDVVKDIGEPAVTAAQKRYRSGMGPKRLILEAALANGFNDTMIDAGNWYEAANHAIRGGFSNVSLSGILADVYNKRLLQGFNYVDQSWRQVADIGSVADFKRVNSYRLNMVGLFEKIGKGGEMKHAELSDESFSNKVETYGRMLGLTRQDIINDDLGALQDVPFRFGRAAGESFNRIFWAEFLDNAVFFCEANGNLKSNAKPLSLAGLEEAETGFYAITAADGARTGVKPAILLVPTGLKNLAAQLYNDTQLGVVALGATNSKAVGPVSNPLAGLYKPVHSPYLNDATLTGYSATAYYLLADPQEVAVIQAVFLNGRQTPFVESTAAEFNTLGIQYRAYMDWGVNKQDPKGGFKQAV